MSESDLIVLKNHSTSSAHKLRLDEDNADVIFLIGEERLPASRGLLAAQSEYFHGLLYGKLDEAKQKEVRLDEQQVPLEAFKLVLEYLHFNEVKLPLDQLGGDAEKCTLFQFVKLAHQYQLTGVIDDICKKLPLHLAMANMPDLLDMAELYNLPALLDSCLDFIDGFAAELLKHDAFLQLSESQLITILSRDTFDVPEEQIFEAVQAWHAERPKDHATNMTAVLTCVRFTNVSYEFFFNSVLTSELGNFMPDVARAQRDKTETVREYKLRRTYRELIGAHEWKPVYYADEVSAEHPFVDKILLDLGTVKQFNYMRFKILKDENLDFYISKDGLRWQHAYYFTYSQYVMYASVILPKLAARFLRIDWPTVSPDMQRECCLENFELLLTTTDFPVRNVATRKLGAIMVRGESIGGHDLLDSSTIKYKPAAYTKSTVHKHQIHKITINFCQIHEVERIYAAFYKRPKNLEILIVSGECTIRKFQPKLSADNTICIENVAERACCVQLCSDTDSAIECTVLECWAKVQ